MTWRMGQWWRADRAYAEGCRLIGGGRPGEAVKAFDRVLAIYPRHVRAQVQRALALAAAGHVGEAIRGARRAAELAPRNHAPLLILGQIQYDAGNLEEARKAFSAALRVDPENRLVNAYLGLTRLAMGRVVEGARALKADLAYAYEGLEGRLITLAEQYLWEHRDQARPLEEQLTPDEGGPDKAPAGFWLHVASAVRIALLWPLARLRGLRSVAMLMAEEALSVKDPEAAIKWLREAEKTGADAQRTALALGEAYLEAGNATAAAEQFARLPEEHRRDPGTALLAGLALFDSGQYEEASEYLSIAARRFTRDFVPAYYRGLCEIALGRPGPAAPWFIETAARLNPHVARKRLEEMLRVGGHPSPD